MHVNIEFWLHKWRNYFCNLVSICLHIFVKQLGIEIKSHIFIANLLIGDSNFGVQILSYTLTFCLQKAINCY